MLRAAKFARYLPEFGWRVTVLTIETSAYAQQDVSLLQGIPDSVRIVRTRYRKLQSMFSYKGKYPALAVIPDAWLGWYPYAVRAGRRICKESRIDAVFSTSPHATAHLIGQRIAKAAGIPSIVDFRDPWYEVPPEPGTPWLLDVAARILERRVMHRSRFAVATTPELCRTLQERYPSIASDRIVAITNGYDETDFAGVQGVARPPSGRLLIVHAGAIHAQHRNPQPLLDSLGRLQRTGKCRRDEIMLQFVGPGDFAGDTGLRECIRRNELQDSVMFIGRTRYDECLQLMAAADVLLLLQASPDTVSLVPVKLYEYLRIGRPVLALVLRGAASAVLEEVGGGWNCDSSVPDEMDACLERIIGAWRGNLLQASAPIQRKLARYERRALTLELAALLDRAASNQSAG
jgi:glycosyltransferase involved in cell wall biosynthesis